MAEQVVLSEDELPPEIAEVRTHVDDHRRPGRVSLMFVARARVACAREVKCAFARVATIAD